MKIVPDQLSPWLQDRLVTLGTDGFGRSDNRQHLRRHFEINAESIATAALSRLARDGKFDVKKAQKAFEELGVATETLDPAGPVDRSVYGRMRAHLHEGAVPFMVCPPSPAQRAGDLFLLATGNFLLLVTKVSRCPRNLLRSPSRPSTTISVTLGEMCLQPTRGNAANENRSLTIPNLERKRADLRPENPAIAVSQLM